MFLKHSTFKTAQLNTEKGIFRNEIYIVGVQIFLKTKLSDDKS